MLHAAFGVCIIFKHRMPQTIISYEDPVLGTFSCIYSDLLA